jgi:hypothetical protein
MQDVFLVTLALGAGVLVIQIVLGLIGGHVDLHHDFHAGDNDGLNLLSVRSISAGAALFGAVGMWLTSRGLPILLTIPAALVAGIAAGVTTAFLTKQMMQLESDGTLRIDNAIGEQGTVYLPIPPKGEGAGKVQFKLQGRTVELGAIGNEPAVIPTGAPVIVVSVVNNDTVEVVPTPLIEGIDA